MRNRESGRTKSGGGWSGGRWVVKTREASGRPKGCGETPECDRNVRRGREPACTPGAPVKGRPPFRPKIRSPPCPWPPCLPRPLIVYLRCTVKGGCPPKNAAESLTRRFDPHL